MSDNTWEVVRKMTDKEIRMVELEFRPYLADDRNGMRKALRKTFRH